MGCDCFGLAGRRSVRSGQGGLGCVSCHWRGAFDEHLGLAHHLVGMGSTVVDSAALALQRSVGSLLVFMAACAPCGTTGWLVTCHFVCGLQRLGCSFAKNCRHVGDGLCASLPSPALALAYPMVVGHGGGVAHRPLGFDAGRVLVELCSGRHAFHVST